MMVNPDAQPTIAATWPTRLAGLSASAAALSLVLLVLWRADLVDAAYGQYAGCPGCLVLPSMAHDLRLLMVLPLLWLLAWRWRSLRIPLALLVLPLVLVFVVDLVVFKALNMRLYWSDLLKFGGEAKANAQVVGNILQNSQSQVLLALALLASLLAVAACFFPAGPQQQRVWLSLGLALGAIGWLWPEPSYLHRESYRNVIEVNRPSGVDALYSSEFAAALEQAPEPAPWCQQNPAPSRPNVIVIAVESLSSYHSALLSGVLDLTPKLDQWMQRSSYFTEFNANGFTTDGGLIALFAGVAPVPAQHRYRSAQAFAGFGSAVDDFYRRLHAAGYRSAFLKSSDLGFLDNGTWLKGLGFQHVEDSTAAFYDGLPKGQFGAVEDRELYRRLLHWIDEQPPDQPYFVGMLTTSSHPPFVVPGTRTLDEERTFRYVDDTLDELLRALEQRSFFDHGILLITGDHRSMTPLKPGEYERFGPLAYQRVPMLVMGASGLPRGPIAGHFQQTDVLPSLLSTIEPQYCRAPWQGQLLGQAARPAEIAILVNGHERDAIWLLHAAGLSTLHLDGDASWTRGPPLPNSSLVNMIHRDRIHRGPVADNFVSSILGW